MPNFTNAAKNLMLDQLFSATGAITHVSLHTADPGTTGANEVSGGTPAYARKAISGASLGAASGGAKSSGASLVFDVPGATTVAHVGYWTASTAGTFMGSDPVTSEAFGSQGTYTLTAQSFDLNAA